MAKKKDGKQGETSPEEALGKRVDAMMDPKLPDPAPAAKPGDVPPLDIFKDAPADVAKVAKTATTAKTAPEVSGDLLEKVDTQAAEAPSEPKPQLVTKYPAKPEKEKTPNPAPEPEETPEEPPEEAADEPGDDETSDDKTADLDDQATDQAVDDIASKEADTMLALQDAHGRHGSQPSKSSWKDKIKRILKSKWTWITLAVIVLILLIVPFTRYKIIGIFIKESVTVTVIDSKTATPVSSATVQLAGKSAKTGGNGQAKLKVPPGNSKLLISKQYYQTSSTSYFVKLSASTTKVELAATGRQVPITVLNKITGKPLANVDIKALKTSAKTDARGKTTLVLPADSTSAPAVISFQGYNNSKITVQVTDQVVAANTFNLVPSGHVYFLAGSAGNLDVVKTNLDGSARQTVLSDIGGSGTSLTASSDWRYVAVKAPGGSGPAALYLINTLNDKVTKFDSNNAAFNLIGWYKHNFMYQAVSNTVSQTQTGHEVLKSYDADQQQLNQLDQSQADDGSYQHFYNFYVMNNLLAYNTQWYAAGGNLGGKTASIRGVQPDGQNKKDYQTFPAAGLGTIQMATYQPQAVYYGVRNEANGQTTYYNFANKTVNTVNLDPAVMSKRYATFFTAPVDSRTFWADPGSGSLYTGNATAGNPQPIPNAGSGAYVAQGWYSSQYVLATKGSQLYIVAAGQSSSRPPLNISAVYLPDGAFKNSAYSDGP